jgi:hypothetical protein
MDFNRLNLDSEGVFTIANQEVSKTALVFDRVDYDLKSGTQGGAPVWTIELFNGRSGRVGVFEIAADSGSILRQELDEKYRKEITREDREFLKEEERRDFAYEDREGGGLPGFFDRLGKRFKKRGRQFENFFTGRGWRED